MNAERWARVEAIVADAMEIPADQRAAAISTACGDDASLRTDVLSLLAQWA